MAIQPQTPDDMWRLIARLSKKIEHLERKAPTVRQGVATVAVAAGDSFPSIALGFTWPIAHDRFLASIWPAASWAGFFLRGAQTNGLGNGIVGIASTIAQNVDVHWISIGR